jgi:hypothetical protein
VKTRKQTKMKHLFRLATVAILLSVSIHIYAAKEVAKAKKGFVLKFSGFELKGFNNLSLFSKTGFLLKGNFTSVDKAPQNTNVNSFITLQRGNTTYIYPYKHKVSVPFYKKPVTIKL